MFASGLSMMANDGTGHENRISIGTSGWTYDGWRGSLYPHGLRKSDWLSFFGSQFSTVEINGSFYRTPSLQAVQAWHDQTPKDFVFAWKASKFITHWKRLSPKCENSIALMDTRLRALEPKISVVLFQLPPNFAQDAQRLTSFLRMLPRCYRYAFEFRHKSWYVDRVLKILQDANVALCLSDHADAPAPWETTAQHVYVRGHGPSGRYHGTYPARTLRRWADAALSWQFEKRQVYIYFDNDQKAAAPKDARRLATMSVQRPRRLGLPKSSQGSSAPDSQAGSRALRFRAVLTLPQSRSTRPVAATRPKSRSMSDRPQVPFARTPETRRRIGMGNLVVGAVTSKQNFKTRKEPMSGIWHLPVRKPKSVIRSGRRTTTSPQHVNLPPDARRTPGPADTRVSGTRQRLVEDALE